MMDIAKGVYQRFHEENSDEVMKALNLSFILRKAATISTPQMEVTEEDGIWTITTSTMLKSMSLTFEVGKPFDDVTPDGRKVSSLVTVEGNKFICVQTAKNKGDKSTKSIREFKDDECIVTLEIIGTDIVSIQKFKRL